MDRSRVRAPNWAVHEVEFLLQKVEENILVVENKKTDGLHVSDKIRTWERITNELNLFSNSFRTSKMVKEKWRKIKKEARGVGAIERKEVAGTGGGPAPSTSYPYWVPRVRSLLSVSARGFEPDFDSDSMVMAQRDTEDEEVVAWSQPDRLLLSTPLHPLLRYNENIVLDLPVISQSPPITTSTTTTATTTTATTTTATTTTATTTTATITTATTSTATTSSTTVTTPFPDPGIPTTSNATTVSPSSVSGPAAATARLNTRRAMATSRRRPPSAAAEAAIAVKEFTELKKSLLQVEKDEFLKTSEEEREWRKEKRSWKRQEKKEKSQDREEKRRRKAKKEAYMELKRDNEMKKLLLEIELLEKEVEEKRKQE